MAKVQTERLRSCVCTRGLRHLGAAAGPGRTRKHRHSSLRGAAVTGACGLGWNGDGLVACTVTVPRQGRGMATASNLAKGPNSTTRLDGHRRARGACERRECDITAVFAITGKGHNDRQRSTARAKRDQGKTVWETRVRVLCSTKGCKNMGVTRTRHCVRVGRCSRTAKP